MQAGYHGLQKTQQGVHNMIKQRIINKNERELAKQQGKSDLLANAAKNAANQKEFNEKHGLNSETMDELTKTNISTMASQNEKLIARLSKKRTRLLAELDLADAQQRHEIQQRLRQLDALEKEVEKFKAMGGKDAMEARIQLAEMENKLKMIEAQGDVENQMIYERGKTEKAKEDAERAGLRGALFHNGILGLFRKTKQDLDAAWIEYDRAIVQGNTKIAKKTLDRISKLMKKTNCSEEDQKRYRDAIVQLQHVDRDRQ